MPVKLPLYDRRMLKFMDFCIDNNIARTKAIFLANIGFDHAGNLKQVLEGKRSFTLNHLLAAINTYEVNLNWIFGIETNMFRTMKTITPVEMLKDALAALELETSNRSKQLSKAESRKELEPEYSSQ